MEKDQTKASVSALKNVLSKHFACLFSYDYFDEKSARVGQLNVLLANLESIVSLLIDISVEGELTSKLKGCTYRQKHARGFKETC